MGVVVLLWPLIQEQLLGFDAFDLYYVPLHDILMAVENQCLTAEAVPELITGSKPLHSSQNAPA
eukprot:6360956-Amphidinium_carterae.1